MRVPTLVLAYVPPLNPHLVSEAHWQRLLSLCSIPDREPLLAFASERAAGLLPEAEILLTGWGCPMIDGHVLQQAPHLRAIVHAAGTVKQHIAAECWDRG